MPIIAIGRVLSSGCIIHARFNSANRNDAWADITDSRVGGSRWNYHLGYFWTGIESIFK